MQGIFYILICASILASMINSEILETQKSNNFDQKIRTDEIRLFNNPIIYLNIYKYFGKEKSNSRWLLKNHSKWTTAKNWIAAHWMALLTMAVVIFNLKKKKLLQLH